MKRKFRIITVNHKKFAWWCSFNHGTEIHLSPECDKTAVITVAFPSKVSDDFYSLFPLFVIMQNQKQICRVKLIEPKMISLFLIYLQNDFQSRKTLSFDGCTLLRQMGWHIIQMENGFGW